MSRAEYKVVSDEEYKNHPYGELFVITTAIQQHKKFVQLLNQTKSIIGDQRFSLIGEMAVGVNNHRAVEVEELCHQDSRWSSIFGKVWKDFEKTTKEAIDQMYGKTGG